MSEGASVRLVPDRFIPEGSSGTQVSHRAICVLTTPAEQERFLEGVEILGGVPYTVRVERAHYGSVLPDGHHPTCPLAHDRHAPPGGEMGAKLGLWVMDPLRFGEG
jgi:hypothetical protein